MATQFTVRHSGDIVIIDIANASFRALAADLGNTNLFLALWTGGTLHVVGDERRDPVALLNYLATERVDFVKTTPSHWCAVFRAYKEGFPLRLRYLLLGELDSFLGCDDRLASGGEIEQCGSHLDRGLLAKVAPSDVHLVLQCGLFLNAAFTTKSIENRER